MSSARLLLVDDEQQMRTMLRRILERRGYSIVGEAENGLLGVEAAAKLQPDIVLMDLNMPQMNGIEATRCIKDANPAIHVLFLSAYVDESLRKSATEAGAAEWVIKGSPPKNLYEALERVAGTSKSAA